jgi:nitrate reductase molybdenum cofactor assembly chaperone NarJ/NarW
MRILKVISRLLDYPVADIRSYRADLAMEISSAREISPEMRGELLQVLERLCSGELMDAQENYGILFDQGRSLSLHLFEHVHGESRDRGQAMVDLMNIYQQNGFELDALELPDYLPLFLEYLANRPDLEVREWLADVAPIMAQVAARLEERGDNGRNYAVQLDALLMIAGQQQQLEVLRGSFAEEEPDNTPEAIDREWEETAVTFGGPEDSCTSQATKPAKEIEPLRWVEAPVATTTQEQLTATAARRGYAS